MEVAVKELDWWWPVALADEAAEGPVGLTLLGQSLVLWRGVDGAPVVLTDRCPHRGAKLSISSPRSSAAST